MTVKNRNLKNLQIDHTKEIQWKEKGIKKRNHRLKMMANSDKLSSWKYS
jgi:hypothetical protein